MPSSKKFATKLLAHKPSISDETHGDSGNTSSGVTSNQSGYSGDSRSTKTNTIGNVSSKINTSTTRINQSKNFCYIHQYANSNTRFVFLMTGNCNKDNTIAIQNSKGMERNNDSDGNSNARTGSSGQGFTTSDQAGTDTDTDTDTSTASSFFSTQSKENSDLEIHAVSLGWRRPTPFHPPGWKLIVRPRPGTTLHPLDPRGRTPMPLHQRIDPRLKPKCRKIPLLIPLERTKKRNRQEMDNNPREYANMPIRAPKAERMSTHERMNVRSQARTMPTNLLTDIMTSFDKLHGSEAHKEVKISTHLKATTLTAQEPIKTTPRNPKDQGIFQGSRKSQPPTILTLSDQRLHE